MKGFGRSQKPPWKLQRKTLEIHGGGSMHEHYLRPPVHRVVAYPLGSFERAARLFSGEEQGFIYSRINNETVDYLERRYASLEGAQRALGTASGMAAVKLVVEFFAHKGHVVASNRLYGGVFHLLGEQLPKLGIETTFVANPHDLTQWVRAINPGITRLLYLETPSNPLIDIFDIRPLADIAHTYEIPLVVDSTLATPALLRPLEHGADIVVASLSKYIGDGKAIGGIVAGDALRIDDMRLNWLRDSGCCMSPDTASVFLDDIESLTARMREHCENAEHIARFLQSHPNVLRLRYPSIGTGARKRHALMPSGFGGLMAFEVRGGWKAARRVLESLYLFWHTANIGESRSLIIHPWSTTHGQMSNEEKQKAGITDNMLRLSIGREDPIDLEKDLSQALKHA